MFYPGPPPPRRLVASRDIAAGEVVLSEPSELFLPYIQPATGLGCCVECLVEVGDKKINYIWNQKTREKFVIDWRTRG